MENSVDARMRRVYRRPKVLGRYDRRPGGRAGGVTDEGITIEWRGEGPWLSERACHAGTLPTNEKSFDLLVFSLWSGRVLR